MKLTSNVKKGIIVGSAAMVLTGGITALIKYNKKKAKENIIEDVVNLNEDDETISEMMDEVIDEVKEMVDDSNVKEEIEGADKQEEDKKKKDK